MSIAASLNFRDHMVRLYFVPVLGPIIASRFLCVGVIAICLIQAASLFLHSALWPCPMLRFTGIPCPGCGLSRGLMSFVTGRWADMAAQHLLAPGFLIGVMLCFVGAIAPLRVRDRFALSITRFERRVPVVPIFLTLTVLYWCARLVLGQHPDLVLPHAGG